MVPGARWLPGKNYWRVPLTYTNCYMLDKVMGDSVKWKPKVLTAVNRSYGKALAQFRRRDLLSVDRISHPRWDDLSKLQQVGADWLAQGDHCLLADKMGSGKTVQTCVALEGIKADKTLIVCPPSVMKVWEEHIRDWTSLKAFPVSGTITKRRKTIEEAFNTPKSALIFSWSSLRSHSMLSAFGNMKISDKEAESKELNRIEFDVIVADEAHRAKDPRAKQTRALWSIKSKKRWALTGTPIANTTNDFWSILRFLAPKDWPSRVKFIDRYCEVAWNPFSKAPTDVVGFKEATRDEFDELTSYLWLRRSQADILGRKINKLRTKRYAYLPPKHRKIYKEVSKGMLADLENGKLHVSNALVEHSRLMQLSMSMIDIDEDENVRLVEPSPKADVFMNLVDDLGDIPVVVMSSSKQLLNICAERMRKKKIKFGLVTGDLKQSLRNIVYDDFQDGRVNYLLTTIGVSSEGVDFSRAQTMVMLQRPWSLIQTLQAEDRIRRWTQVKDEVEIIDIVTADTIDERIRDVLNTKKKRLAELTYEEVKDLLE